MAQAYSALIGGRLRSAERLLEDAERALATAADEPFEPSVGRAASMVANVPAAIAVLRARLARLHGDPERITAFCQQGAGYLTDADRRLLFRWHAAALPNFAAYQNRTTPSSPCSSWHPRSDSHLIAG